MKVSSEVTWDGVFEIVKEEDDGVELDEEGVDDGTEVGVGLEVGWVVGEAVGGESVKVNDHTLLQLLQLPIESFAFTFQYQVPKDKEGV